MNRVSKRFVWIGTLILGMLFLVLAMVTPGEAQRTFEISGAPGVYRMCCYIPGKFEQFTVEDETEIQLAGTESYKNGTVLQLEMRLRKVAVWGETFKVRYKFGGRGVFEKVELPETLESVEWVQEYPISVKQEKEYWCATTTKRRIFTDWAAWTDDQILELPAARLVAGAGFFLCMLIVIVVEGSMIEKRNQKQNQRYPRLMELTEEYIHAHWAQDGSKEYAQWIHKKTKYREWFVYTALMGFLLFGVLSWIWKAANWFFWVVSVWLLTLLAMTAYDLKLCNDIVKLTEKGVHPTDCIWCWYRLMGAGDPRIRHWALQDMNLAIWMGKAEDYERSYEMAELLWEALGRKKKGVPYLQYHLCQCRNILYGGMPGDAVYHLEQMQREIDRGNYRKQKKKLLKIEEEFLDKLREMDVETLVLEDNSGTE